MCCVCIGPPKHYQVAWDLGVERRLLPRARVSYLYLLSRGLTWIPWSNLRSFYACTYMMRVIFLVYPDTAKEENCSTSFLKENISMKEKQRWLCISFCQPWCTCIHRTLAIETLSLKISCWLPRVTLPASKWSTSVFPKTFPVKRPWRPWVAP